MFWLLQAAVVAVARLTIERLRAVAVQVATEQQLYPYQLIQVLR
jgi:hypothetical protein